MQNAKAMWNIVIFLAISFFFILEITGCFSNKSKGNSGSELDSNSIVPPDSIKGKVTKEEMQKKLKQLAKSLAPINLKKGAMCYEMAAVPERAEYVCPICGEKTLYTNDFTYFIQYELQDCRNSVPKIKGIDAGLDESQYCKKCSPDIEKPVLCLEYTYAGDTTQQKICDISSNDIEILVEFTNGSKVHAGFNGTEYPLKESVDRLEILLGIQIKQ